MNEERTISFENYWGRRPEDLLARGILKGLEPKILLRAPVVFDLSFPDDSARHSWLLKLPSVLF